MKLCADVHRVLSGHRIDDEQDLIRLHRIADLLQFIHQFFIDMQASSRIDDHIVKMVLLGMFNGLRRDLNRVRLAKREHRHLDLFAQDLQLFDRSRAVDIRCDEERLMILLLEQARELPGSRRLTRTLQPRHHDHRRRARRSGQLAVGAAHQLC